MDAESLVSPFDPNTGKGKEFFNEEFELSQDGDESYAKINVPDFRDGRAGRFLHDFKSNQSAIIDLDKKRCYVMPLDRETVLPPKDMMDLIQKMYNGYYEIDTDTVRNNMRVITPALTDLSEISSKIQATCNSMSVYRLEKMVHGGKSELLDSFLLFFDYIDFDKTIFRFSLQFSNVASILATIPNSPNSSERL